MIHWADPLRASMRLRWARLWIPRFSHLGPAIVVSLVVHAGLLSLNFGLPSLPKIIKDKALEVILVNSRSAKKPTKPQAQAQVNLDGGGNVDENRRATAPLPPSAQSIPGKDIEEARQRVQQMEARQRELATKAKVAPRNSQPETPELEQKTPVLIPTGMDLADSARAMARLEGEIGRNLDEYNKRPRKKNIGTRTEEYRFARYLEDWRAKVERVGTLNYPDAARGKLSGSLILTVSINFDGMIRSVEVNRSSGFPLLDDAAIRIVRMAAPYAAFPPDIRRDIDVLEVTRTWSFTSSNELKAN
jgi:periplasmic protein TonB